MTHFRLSTTSGEPVDEFDAPDLSAAIAKIDEYRTGRDPATRFALDFTDEDRHEQTLGGL